mgnify:CR=1 FL=1
MTAIRGRMLPAAGVDVLLLGPMPTPGVAFLTRALRLSADRVVVTDQGRGFDAHAIEMKAKPARIPSSVQAAAIRRSTFRQSTRSRTIAIPVAMFRMVLTIAVPAAALTAM